MAWSKVEMAKVVIELFEQGQSVNLGIGLPSIVAELIPRELDLVIHSENGVLGVKGRPTKKTISPTLINAGKETVSIHPGASFFDSSLSFGMIRGGHIDHCVLGGMEVDQEGNLANWMIPGKKVTGMGGAMDLVNGAKSVIIMMTHFNKKGEPKLVKKTSLPLTGKNVVDIIVTDHGVFRPVNQSFECIKLAPGINTEDLKLP
jgi:3-oxoacid CoA-transferase subunit B